MFVVSIEKYKLELLHILDENDKFQKLFDFADAYLLFLKIKFNL